MSSSGDETLRKLVKQVAGRKSAKGTEAPAGRKRTTAINIDADLLRRMREIAIDRSDRFGGRASVSALVNEFLRGNLDALDRMATTPPAKRAAK